MKRRIKAESKGIFNRGSRYILKEFQKNKFYPLFLFLLKFNLFAAPLYLILWAGWESGFLIEATAGIVFSLLSATGFDPVIYGNVISVPIKGGTWGALINWDCTGWKSVLALFALIFATEMPLRTKAKGFLLLAPVVYMINIARIWFMFWYVVSFDLAGFAVVHAVVWSWGLITAVVVLWLAWLKTQTNFLQNSRKAGLF